MAKISTNIQDFNELSYHSLYASRYAFRRAGAGDDSAAGKFNRFDNPNHVYFRIFFDFTRGLLNTFDWGQVGVPTAAVMRRDYGITQDYLDRNDFDFTGSALNYLIRNNEWERADMLRDFIHLLSNINTYSPWYFNELIGLGELLERTEFTGEAFTIGEKKGLGIKTLPDAQDTRIGTLLDLYRSICYSWQLHKEILPANLRKFDMWIYIFSTPKRGIHDLYKPQTDNKSINRTIANQQVDDSGWATFDQFEPNFESTQNYITSSKLIHLIDCEINIGSIKSAYGEVKNDEGFSQTYEIGIHVTNAVEQRYNEFLMKNIGDLVRNDFDMDLENITDPIVANKQVTVTSRDTDRLSVERLKSGVNMVSETNTSPQQERIIPGVGNNLGQSMNGLGNAINTITQPLSQQVKQIEQATRSTVTSWTDPKKLTNTLINTGTKELKKLMLGNIFGNNLTNIGSGITQQISRFSANNVVNGDVIRNGWTRKSTNESTPASSLGKSLNNSITTPRVPKSPDGNIFRQ